MTVRRREAVCAWMADEGLDALLISSGSNVRYLTGFTGEGLLVLDGGALICTDSRYRVQAAEEAPEVECAGDGGHLEQAIERLRAIGAKRIGFQGRHLTWASYQKLAEELDGVELVAAADEVARLRQVKDAGEIALIRRAAEIADAAFTTWRERVGPGLRERDAALELEQLMVRGGADKAAFEVIVAAGPNGAKPHACPGERELTTGDLVVVDWGAMVGGYCSDCTRTLAIGELDDRQREVWQAVREAQLAALGAVAPGVACGEVDAAARDLLRERGWTKEFGHGLGHGVGLEVHERPTLCQSSEEKLVKGMIVTIEPGVYIDGWGGVRLEELVLVTEAGMEVLTHAPYDLSGLV